MHVYSKIEFMNISFANFKTVQLIWRFLVLIIEEEMGREQIIRTQNQAWKNYNVINKIVINYTILL